MVLIMITGEMKIMDVVHKYPQTADILLRMQMQCGACSAAHYETIEEGAIAHGLLPSEVLRQLNEVVS
jgi:hybrid cluster-associated redox disulfide protein